MWKFREKKGQGVNTVSTGDYTLISILLMLIIHDDDDDVYVPKALSQLSSIDCTV